MKMPDSLRGFFLMVANLLATEGFLASNADSKVRGSAADLLGYTRRGRNFATYRLIGSDKNLVVYRNITKGVILIFLPPIGIPDGKSRLKNFFSKEFLGVFVSGFHTERRCTVEFLFKGDQEVCFSILNRIEEKVFDLVLGD